MNKARLVDGETKNELRPILGLSLLILATVVAAIYAFIGSGGILIFGLGKNLMDVYFLVYPFLFLPILLMGLWSLRWMAGLLLANSLIAWTIHLVSDWPHSISPVQSYGDMLSLSIVGLGLTAYFLFPRQLRERSVIGVFRNDA